jgi:scaffold protein (connect acetoacetyl-CoA thiolase and HMG-CoA synthase)
VDLARYHRLRSPYYRLEGQRCASCRAVQFPPRASCRRCRGRGLDPYALSGRGTVYAHAEIAQAPKGFNGPYLVALVQLDEGILVTAQLTDVDPDDVAIGLPVEMVTRRLQEQGPQGYLVYGYKFRPTAPSRRDS